MGDRSSPSESACPEPLARRFEAVVLVGDRPAASSEVRSVVARLLDAAMPVALVADASDPSGPSDPAWPPNALRGSSVVAALAELWDRGISPGSTLVVVDDPEADAARDRGRDVDPLLIDAAVVRIDQREHRAERHTVHLRGGLDQVLALLTDQLDRRRRWELPVPASTPGWVLTIEGFDPEQERVHEALLTLSVGLVGLSGAPSMAHPSAAPLVVHAGAYDGGDGSETHLLECPLPVLLAGDLPPDAALRRVLDLRTGVLGEEITSTSASVRSVRLTSIVRRGLLVHRVHAGPGVGTLPEPMLMAPPVTVPLADGAEEGVAWMQVGGTPAGVTVAARATDSLDGDVAIRTQWTTYHAEPASAPPPALVLERLTGHHAESFDHLLDAHRREWARRWADADVVVEGDDELQLALRFALFHLMGAAADGDEAAVGARGLTGPGYRGHVFWDADSFTLPFFAATHPGSARAMLEYRIRRLPAALATAREQGRGGARFPWESARTGRDVTPLSARDRTGRLVPIRTGQLEDHIVADVAWAARCYVDWTGDDAFARGEGLALFVETARYWVSRVRLDSDGRAHIFGVIGPDEYHEPVDDNAFTNVMARWNLRQAAALTAPSAPGGDDGAVRTDERHRWLEVADALADGFDPDTGLYEQCAGFFHLEPLIVAEVAPHRPIAADLLLGAERVRASQVIKQADVLMLHHLVPEEVEPGTLEPNLRFYEPRTAHGSSLSPAIHASLFARARDFDRAMTALHIASRIDLDDLTGSTAAGLHIATMGGLWQALVWGFAGMRPREGRLGIDPILPPAWTALAVNVRYRSSRVSMRREGQDLFVCADPGAPVLIDGTPYDIDSSGLSFTRRRNTWEPH